MGLQKYQRGPSGVRSWPPCCSWGFGGGLRLRQPCSGRKWPGPQTPAAGPGHMDGMEEIGGLSQKGNCTSRVSQGRIPRPGPQGSGR